MRICERHWGMLRQAIDDRGLGDLVAKDGKQAAKQMVEQLEEPDGRQTVKTFDPLMNANWAIHSNVLSTLGLSALAPEAADKCPLCLLTEVHTGGCQDPACTITDYDHWIERAADDQLAAWNELKAAA